MEVVVLRAPAAVDLDVFSVDLPVRMDLDRTIVGVMATNDDASAVTHHVERLGYGIRAAARLDDDVGTPATGRVAHRGGSNVAR